MALEKYQFDAVIVGGGGAGFPLGNGGGPGIARGGDEGRNRNGNPGQPATTYLQGGAGGDSTCLVDFPNQTRCIQAGGGAGGSLGTPGNTNNTVSGGTRGRAIIIFNDGSGTTIVNSGTGTVVGPTIYNTNPQ